jgi:hypothetical protein
MRFWRGLAITMISALLGVSSAVVLSLELARRSPLASCAGRESVRFPGAIPLERRRPASAPNPGGAPRDWPIPMPSGAQSLEPMRCGIIAVSERRFGVLDIRVQTGAVMRAMDASFDAGDEAVERVVPAWARDMLVPWGVGRTVDPRTAVDATVAGDGMAVAGLRFGRLAAVHCVQRPGGMASRAWSVRQRVCSGWRWDAPILARSAALGRLRRQRVGLFGDLATRAAREPLAWPALGPVRTSATQRLPGVRTDVRLGEARSVSGVRRAGAAADGGIGRLPNEEGGRATCRTTPPGHSFIDVRVVREDRSVRLTPSQQASPPRCLRRGTARRRRACRRCA